MNRNKYRHATYFFSHETQFIKGLFVLGLFVNKEGFYFIFGRYALMQMRHF